MTMANDVKWIKISTGVFDDDAFQIIDDLPERDAIELIWFKLLVLAGKQNNHGLFLYKDTIAYTDEMLSSIFHRPLNTVRLAMETFQSLQMIEVIDDVYAIPNWDKYQSLDSLESKKERDKEYSKKYREKQKMLIEEKKSSDSRLTSDERSYSISSSNSTSYSFDKHSNLENYIYLLNDYKYKEYIDMNVELNECIKQWFGYKDEKKPRNSNHYGERGMKTLLTQFVDNHKTYGTYAVIKVVEKSMANNYAGVFFENCKDFIKPMSRMDEWDGA